MFEFVYPARRYFHGSRLNENANITTDRSCKDKNTGISVLYDAAWRHEKQGREKERETEDSVRECVDPCGGTVGNRLSDIARYRKRDARVGTLLKSAINVAI